MSQPALFVAANNATVPVMRREQRVNMELFGSSKSAEHPTPLPIVERLAGGGPIDLDPCSNSKEQPNIPAAHHFTEADDGLAQEWHGRVYMNPPYGAVLPAWIDKLVSEYEAGRVSEAIVMVYTKNDTRWWKRLRADAICLLEGRQKFGNSKGSAAFPSSLCYVGRDVDRFVTQFWPLGRCWRPIIRPERPIVGFRAINGVIHYGYDRPLCGTPAQSHRMDVGEVGGFDRCSWCMSAIVDPLLTDRNGGR